MSDKWDFVDFSFLSCHFFLIHFFPKNLLTHCFWLYYSLDKVIIVIDFLKIEKKLFLLLIFIFIFIKFKKIVFIKYWLLYHQKCPPNQSFIFSRDSEDPQSLQNPLFLQKHKMHAELLGCGQTVEGQLGVRLSEPSIPVPDRISEFFGKFELSGRSQNGRSLDSEDSGEFSEFLRKKIIFSSLIFTEISFK